jgi:hypothetical protein
MESMESERLLPSSRRWGGVGLVVFLAAVSGGAALGQGTGGTAVVPAAGDHVLVLENTLIRAMTDQALSTKKSKDGARVSFTVSQDVVVHHVLAIPRGATVHGEVVSIKKAGALSGSPQLTLKLDTLEMGGESYPLDTYQFTVEGDSKTKPTPDEVGQATEFGALAGAVVSAKRKDGPTRASNIEYMTAGAAAGAGAVEAASALAPGPVLEIPAETEMDFYLALPISVKAVSAEEAERLGKKVSPGGPVLYVRGERP